MVSMPNFLKRKTNTERLQESFSILNTLNSSNNELTQKFNREIFNKVMEEAQNLSNPITPAEEEALVKDLLTQIILDHFAQSFASMTFKELKDDATKLAEFKQEIHTIDQTYATTTDLEDFFKNDYLNRPDGTTGNPLWQNPNFTEGNPELSSKALEKTDLYEQKSLEDFEAKDLLKEVLNYIKHLPEDDKPEVEIGGTKRKVDTLIDLKLYLSINHKDPNHLKNSFTDRASILRLNNISFLNTALSKIKRSASPNIKLLCSKYFHLLSESLNPDFAENLKVEILKPENGNLLLAFNNILGQHIRGIDQLNEYELAQFFSSKRDLKLISSISDDAAFNAQFTTLQEIIKNIYQTNKSEYISYLYEQFVENPDIKVGGVTYITQTARSKVLDILTVKEESADFGIDSTRLKELQAKAKQYPERLRNNFKNSKLSITRNREEMKDLRRSRLDVAKLRAYNAALDLELTNSDLANGIGTDKIKETVFQKAIKEDLDSLFLDYQAPPKANKLRKTFNRATSWFGSKMAVASTGTAILVPTALKFGLKTSAAAVAGPAAAIGLGALFMKPLARRVLNRRASDNNERIGLNFMEATRDMTGNVNDSLFSSKDDIENEYIKSQQQELTNLQARLSNKIDRELNTDPQIQSQKELLKNSITNNDDPIQINKLALELKKLISKKITEISTKEYEHILKEVEDKRAKYVGRLIAESALGMTAMMATLGVVEGLGYIAGIGDSAAAAEPPSTNDPSGATSSGSSNSEGNSVFDKPEDKPSGSAKNTPNTSKTVEIARGNIEEAHTAAHTAAVEAVQAKDFKFTVPTDAQLAGTTNKDPGLVRLFRAWTDNKLSVSEAYEAAKMLKLDNVNLIRDGQELVIPKEAMEFISQKTDITPSKLAERDILSQYIKYNKA